MGFLWIRFNQIGVVFGGEGCCFRINAKIDMLRDIVKKWIRRNDKGKPQRCEDIRIRIWQINL